MKYRPLLLVASICSVLFLSGCASSSDSSLVQVNSINNPDINISNYKTYYLSPVNPNIRDSLQYKEFAAYVIKVMKKDHFLLEKDPKKAASVVFLEYGITKPQNHSYTYQSPTWGQTGISSADTYGSSTYYTPSYGVTGYQTKIGTVTTYGRYIKLTAFDYPTFLKHNQLKELWKTVITSTGTNGDLRAIFPLMLKASTPYIASNTKRIKHLSVDSDGSINE